MSNLEETYKLRKFYEGYKISKCNQEIMTEYLLQVAREVRSQASVKNNVEFMKFLVTHIRTDLDKLTKKDVNKFIDEVNGMRRKRDGKEVSDAPKKYRIGLTRFLRHYGEETGNKSLIELANFNFSKIKLLRKLPEDLLSREDVHKMIAAANNALEKALIATIYETGARRGEIVNCRVKDVIQNPNGFYIRLNGKTGARQVLFHLYLTFRPPMKK
jgi:integrase